MTNKNDYSYWQKAIAGEPFETERGSPRAGWWRERSGKAVYAIWYGEDGVVQCERSDRKDTGASMTPDDVDELFGWVCRYPIPAEVYNSVAWEGKAIDPLYTTSLSIEQSQQGIIWTEELGRKILAQDIENYDERGFPLPPRNHNAPPEDLTPEQAIAKRVTDLEDRFDAWLKKIGGEARTMAEAETLANYKNRFTALESEGTAARKAEKAPHWEAGKAVDEKWNPSISLAETAKSRAERMIQAFRNKEDIRRKKEADEANAVARKAQEERARIEGVPEAEVALFIDPVPEVVAQPVKIAGARGGSRKVEDAVTDMRAFLAYLASRAEAIPADIAIVSEKYAKTLKKAGIIAAGMDGKSK